MSPKRPRLVDRSGSSTSSETLRKKVKTTDNDDSPNLIRVHIVPAKIDSAEFWELSTYLDAGVTLTGSKGYGSFQLVSSLDYGVADVIVTAVHMKKRLVRHIPWDVLSTKHVVRPRWLEQCMETKTLVPFEDFVAVPELKASKKDDESSDWFLDASYSDGKGELPVDAMECLVPPDMVKSQDDINYSQSSSCLRLSPLTCPNSGLVAELSILRRSRELEGQNINALGYERAIGMIKSYPSIITPESISVEIAKLPHIGEKILSKIIEFVEDGEIAESRSLANSQRYQSLSTFTKVYGIGPTTARNLYERGLRTMEDLERYYDVHAGDVELDDVQTSGKIKGIPFLSMSVGIRLLDELEQQIPRDEVEEIRTSVMDELQKIQPGCVSTITGGYRRGKAWSNDVDIVISHKSLQSGGGYVEGLCEKLVTRLYERDLVTHVMHLSGFHEHNALRTAHWDSLQKALTVFRLAKDDSKKRQHRRVDLIFASPEVYWTAVTGWTGSKLFERDVRLWAKNHGLKFDSSGITRRRDSKLFFPRSEREVFHMFGLPWIEPAMRNANA